MEKKGLSLKKLGWYYVVGITVALAMIGTIVILIYHFGHENQRNITSSFFSSLFTPIFFASLAVGFIAQMINGTLGMAFGVTSSIFLLNIGIPPVFASASIHLAKVFVGALSGISHWQFGNVDKKLLIKLIISSAIGAIVGAYVLSSVNGKAILPYIAIYLFLMGIFILLKSLQVIKTVKSERGIIPIAAIGGFVGAVGGGGWGPIVTSSLISFGNMPRKVVGSVSAAEFFMAVASVITFISMIGLRNWVITVGLIVGGMLASPLAAFLVRKIRPFKLMLAVGIHIVILSIRNLIVAFS